MTTAAAVTVRERPILFSGEMVRAILDGRKTQTRRVLLPQPDGALDYEKGNVRSFVDLGTEVATGRAVFGARREDGDPIVAFRDGRDGIKDDIPCPLGDVGARLWVREAFSFSTNWNPSWYAETGEKCEFWYWADGNPHYGDWSKPKPSIHMPRCASRLTLEITAVRVERVQSISEDDARAEGLADSVGHLNTVQDRDGTNLGVSLDGDYDARNRYIDLWDSLNKKRGYGWDVNPWVWVIEFKRLET